MRRVIFICIALISCVVSSRGGVWSVDELTQPKKYDRHNYVANPDAILSDATVRSVNLLLADVESQTNAQVAVVVIDDFAGTDVDDFATKLFMDWGLGEEGSDNGVLLLVAKNSKNYAIRTGRGIGSVLSDLESGAIGREILVPNFRNNDYNRGVLEATQKIHSEMTSPEAVKEIKEMSARMKKNDSESVLDVILFYVWCCVALTAILAVWVVYRVKKTGSMERHRRYVVLHPMMRVLYGLGFVGLGMPFLVYFPLKLFLKDLRDGVHNCPNCGTEMRKLDEISDNEHLTPAQDAEERFNSVDYDVWECPNCGEEDVYAFENQDSELVECPHCHAKTARYVRDRVIKMPTATSEGVAVKEFDCLNCKKRSSRQYKLPRRPNGGNMAAAAAIPFILGSMGRGGGFGGGGFGGGSFGGGSTGGGGASGSW